MAYVYAKLGARLLICARRLERLEAVRDACLSKGSPQVWFWWVCFHEIRSIGRKWSTYRVGVVRSGQGFLFNLLPLQNCVYVWAVSATAPALRSTGWYRLFNVFSALDSKAFTRRNTLVFVSVFRVFSAFVDSRRQRVHARIYECSYHRSHTKLRAENMWYILFSCRLGSSKPISTRMIPRRKWSTFASRSMTVCWWVYYCEQNVLLR